MSYLWWACKTEQAASLGDAGDSWYQFVVSQYYQKTELNKKGVFQRNRFLTLFLCSFWYKSIGIFKKWSQFGIIHFFKQLFGAIWLFETPFRGWNDFYMDYSTDTPTHPSMQYRYASGIHSRTTSQITRTNSRITRTTSYMFVKSVSSSLWRNSVTPENQFQPVPATPKNPVQYRTPSTCSNASCVFDRLCMACGGPRSQCTDSSYA